MSETKKPLKSSTLYEGQHSTSYGHNTEFLPYCQKLSDSADSLLAAIAALMIVITLLGGVR